MRYRLGDCRLERGAPARRAGPDRRGRRRLEVSRLETVAPAPGAQPLGGNDGLEAADRIADIGVDYQVVIFGIGGGFVASALETPLDGRLVFGAAPAQAPGEFLEARRQDKDGDHFVSIMLPNLTRALNVDIEEDVAAGGNRSFERGARGAIAGVEDPRRLRKFVPSQPAIKFFFAHEVIIEPVRFILARSSRGQRDRRFKTLDGVERGPRDGGFARARGCRKDEYYAAPRTTIRVHHLEYIGKCRSANHVLKYHYSTFWTCSRIFSTSTFISMMLF